MTVLIDEAERNEDGELIATVPSFGIGGPKEKEVNVTRLFRPGPRKSNNLKHLLAEARLVDHGTELDNPARPANAEIAKEAIERFEEEDLKPAWRVCDEGVEFP